MNRSVSHNQNPTYGS